MLAELREQLQTEETLQQVTYHLSRCRRQSPSRRPPSRKPLLHGSNGAHAVQQRAARRRTAKPSRLDTLDARISLLHEQYTSDLARLAAAAEAGSVLGYFAPGPCVFCGAAPEHQHLNDDCADDTTAFPEFVREDQRKTIALREDLNQAVDGVRADLAGRAKRLRPTRSRR
ncbi:hypothetical protein ACFQ1S_11415 [Kibdelosporangium lantanae]|uniref:Uncharacterized protein n=1 Tax=Kibdelosporangium lantanae TaxID=1497396 RepID=A0ABW3M663_9PSEU